MSETAAGTKRRTRVTSDERLVLNAVRTGVIKPSQVRLYKSMMKHDPVNTRRLLVRLRRVIQ
jgi:hypothetical protein